MDAGCGTSGGGCPSVLAASPDTMRTSRRRDGTQRGRTQAPALVDRSWRRHRPSRGCTRPGLRPSGPVAREPRAAEVVWCRVGVGIEGCVAMPRIARPPADRHLLRVHRVAHDEISRWRIGRQAGEEVHGKVERTPPRIDRRRSPDVRRTKLRQDERCLRRCHEVVGSPTLVVPRVFAVFIEWDAPRHLLRRRVDLECATETANCGQHLTRHDSHRSIRSQGDPLDPAAAVLDGRLVDAQVENDHERP